MNVAKLRVKICNDKEKIKSEMKKMVSHGQLCKQLQTKG